jgi:hypothetical protein
MTCKEVSIIFDHCLWPNMDYWLDYYPEVLDSIKAAFLGIGPRVVVHTSHKNREGILRVQQGSTSLDFRIFWPSIPELVPLYVLGSKRSVIELAVLCWLVNNGLHYENIDKPIASSILMNNARFKDFDTLMHKLELAEEYLIQEEAKNTSELESFILKILGYYELLDK